MTTDTLTERLATQPHVMRFDIGLDEHTRRHGISLTDDFVTHFWEAKLWGRVSTGEAVELTREGTTAAKALANLEAAIAEQGWTIKEKGTR